LASQECGSLDSGYANGAKKRHSSGLPNGSVILSPAMVFSMDD